MKMNKKALSEMVGYVLLIVIAVSLSAGVYVFLKVYIPKDTPKCPDDIKMIVQGYECAINSQTQQGTLKLNLTNRGLFTIDAVYIRLGAEGKKVRDLINDRNVYIIVNNERGLPPGETYKYTNQLLTDLQEKMVLEIQPAIWDENLKVLAACTNSVITQPITCTS